MIMLAKSHRVATVVVSIDLPIGALLLLLAMLSSVE
jgi:hypothetical protein